MIKKIERGNSITEYSIHGTGRPLVFLHGYLEAKEVWAPLTAALEKRFTTICIDLPGHGRSETVGEIHTMDYLADTVRAVLEECEIKRALVIGHSLGGYVTLSIVEKYPELLSGYVLFHSHPHPDSPEAISKRKREIGVVRAGKKNIMYPGNLEMMFAKKNLGIFNAELEKLEEIASGNSAEGIIALLNGMMSRPSRVSAVEKGIVPLLWILGRWDRYFSPEKALNAVTLPRNAEVKILEESGHLGFLEETSLSSGIIEAFADKLSW